jgi:Kef-type K+ transport system membrane component KefB
MTNPQLALHFFVQIVVILVGCQLVGYVAKRFGQPQVVAEMLAGVLLGPSLLGLFWPEWYTKLFPQESMKVLFPVSQLGIAAYMFVVGLEFRVDVVGRRLKSAATVSLAGMLMPCIMGAVLGWFFYHHTSFFPSRTTGLQAATFLGAALCITALPVLARIIHSKRLSGTVMATISLGAGAIGDAAAWCLLAVVLAGIDGDARHAVLTIAGGIGYVCLAVFLVKPLLARWARSMGPRKELSDREFVVCLMMMAAGSWFTEAIGLHSVFGAFVMGAVMPRGVISQALIERVQPLTVGLLLPLFFAYSGLNTQMGLLDSGYLWLMAALVLIVAIAGKGGACWLSARASGLTNRDALGIATLMNARGLTELIIINIGLQRGLITPALFTILVIMAVVTTLMTSPLFDWLIGGKRPEVEPEPEVAPASFEDAHPLP